MATLATTVPIGPAVSTSEVKELALSLSAKAVIDADEDAVPAIPTSSRPITTQQRETRTDAQNSIPSFTDRDAAAACPNAPFEVPGSTLESTVSKTSSYTTNTPGLLEKYIQLALTGHSTASTHSQCKCPLPKIFIEDKKNPHLQPTLQRGIVNRILVYAGSFHPPHISHRAVLYDGFFHSGADLNLVAAIVLPWSEVPMIYGSEAQPIVLRQEDAGVLWTGGYTVPPVLQKCYFSKFIETARTEIEADVGAEYFREVSCSEVESPLYTGPVTEESENHLGNWAFVYPGEDEGFGTFLRNLKSCASEDGFIINDVRLLGADNVRSIRVPSSDPWGCREYLLSDAGRDLSYCSNGHHKCRDDKCEVMKFDINNVPGTTSSCNELPKSYRGDGTVPSALTRLRRYSPWQSVSISAQLAQSLAERAAEAYYLASGFGGADSAGQAELVARLARTYVTRDSFAFSRLKECHSDLSRVRYIPRLNSLPKPGVSSTRIRKLILTSENEENVRTSMAGMALNPTLFARMLAGKAGAPKILSLSEHVESWCDGGWASRGAKKEPAKVEESYGENGADKGKNVDSAETPKLEVAEQ